MKTKGLYMIIACLVATLLVLSTVFIMRYRESEDVNHRTNIGTQNNTNSTFGIGRLNENQSSNYHSKEVQDTIASKSIVDPKALNISRAVQPSLVVRFADLFPDEVYRSDNTLLIDGIIQRVDEENDGVYVIDESGVSIYINFDFMNLTLERKDYISGYIQVGRRISAMCVEEGRTLIVNSFKIW
ncbi:hypothetical protein OQZ33_00465 [Pedobacter sp. MC2016-05]|uniref:hypothetical protein n=1 Tax=Pedobacter sp. MC2016-05 TaxID=2994474 RepID=UPI002246424B|nr:hypothetical protein [Pedobacter sp. MC2016-05]MCX2472791.1 hypothetical protein [Pedobacter sp. MC2016-05]